MADEVLIQYITADEARPVRNQLLRQNATPDELIYPGDDDADTAHFAAFRNDTILGIASVYRQSPDRAFLTGDEHEDIGVWRLRAMATVPEVRGAGIGSRLLQACIGYVAMYGGTFLWCDARIGAVGFYERYGFQTRGEQYEVPRVGPHFFMWRAITQDDAAYGIQITS